MAALTGTAIAQSAEPRDCAQLRIDNGWSRSEYRACKREEIQRDIDRLDAEFAKMREWLRARGLDVTDAGVITDAEGRILAQIEASNAALVVSNADLVVSNADLVVSNAALRARIDALDLRIKTADEEYIRILKEFEQAVMEGL